MNEEADPSGLPACHSRRTLDSEPGSLFCVHPRHAFKGCRISASVCRVCPLWRQPPPAVFRTFPPEPEPEPEKAPAGRSFGTCDFLGEQVGLRPCATCRGTVLLKVFACSHPRHMETTVAECAVCRDYKKKSSESPS